MSQQQSNMAITKDLNYAVESNYLITSNKEKCRSILAKNDVSVNDIIDFLISLHTVLEVALNTLFRKTSLLEVKKSIDSRVVMSNLDRINFIDKTVLFIYNSKFSLDSGEKISKATEYHSLIGKLRNFSDTRNKLLHGHAIISSGSRIESTDTYNKLNIPHMNSQVKDFKYIIDGMRFYVENLVSLTAYDKEDIITKYLNCSFLD